MRINKHIQYQRLLSKLVIPFFSMLLLVSCATVQKESSRPVFDKIVRVEPTEINIALDIEDPGKIIVTQGSACGKSDQPGEEEVILCDSNAHRLGVGLPLR